MFSVFREKIKDNGRLKGKRVFVGMSGGVDSSLSAALLQKNKADVTGVFMKGWYPDFVSCDWKEERRDAMRVCAELGIPFETFHLEEAYKKEVADYMVGEYRAGKTPNPDVMCNKHVKFGAFLGRSLKDGAEMIATGHYARTRQREDGKVELLAGVDKEKDQSYFLWTLTQNQLSRVIFPIGDYTKTEVRRKAKNMSIPVASKKDSQGVCFLGKLSMREFLKEYVGPQQAGDILDEDGRVIGKHEGALFYTLGQRKGFKITKKDPQTPKYYVIDKDMESNTITVSTEPAGFFKQETEGIISIEKTNWTTEDPPVEGSTLQVRTRYRQPLKNCKILEIDEGNKRARVQIENIEEPAASGQSLVIYNGEVCVGGGIIQ